MAHERKRHLSKILTDRLRFSPIVGVLGQRQVGKTTMIQKVAGDYVSLDRKPFLSLAQNETESFLRDRKPPFAIDEAQMAPEIFPELKEIVRTNKRPGQYILSGSVRFTSRKLIKESLTGRILNIELLPFSISEIEQIDLGSSLIDLLKGDWKKFQTQALKRSLTLNHLKKYASQGSLPGFTFTRNHSILENQFETHLDTILERDLQLIYETKLSSLKIIEVLKFIAQHIGTPFNIAELRRETRLSDQTVLKLISAFESLFLIRSFKCIGTKRFGYYFEDPGTCMYLREKNDPLSISMISQSLFSHLREQFHYRPELGGQFFMYHKHSGAEVPICFHSKIGTIGIIPILDSHINKSAMMCAESFLKHFKGSTVVIAHSGENFEKLSSHLFSVPIGSIC